MKNVWLTSNKTEMTVITMNEIIVHQDVYFVPTGRCEKLIMLIHRCSAKNQMWQFKRKRRQQFLDKVVPYINSKIGKFVETQGYSHWKIELYGSKNLYDVEAMRDQNYRVYMTNTYIKKLKVTPNESQ
jgi:hypothetical protein